MSPARSFLVCPTPTDNPQLPFSGHARRRPVHHSGVIAIIILMAVCFGIGVAVLLWGGR